MAMYNPHLEVPGSSVSRQQGIVQQAAGRHAVVRHAVKHSLSCCRVVLGCMGGKSQEKRSRGC